MPHKDPISRKAYMDSYNARRRPLRPALPDVVVPLGPGRRVGHIVDAATECWNWYGANNGVGYGMVGIGGRRASGGGNKLAHRVYYERHRGPIPDGMVIDHLCRNRGCVNPAHMEVVSNAENVKRGKRCRA